MLLGRLLTTTARPDQAVKLGPHLGVRELEPPLRLGPVLADSGWSILATSFGECLFFSAGYTPCFSSAFVFVGECVHAVDPHDSYVVVPQ